MRAKGTLANTILQGKLKGNRSYEESVQDVKEWTGLSSNEMGSEPETVWRKRVSRTE